MHFSWISKFSAMFLLTSFPELPFYPLNVDAAGRIPILASRADAKQLLLPKFQQPEKSSKWSRDNLQVPAKRKIQYKKSKNRLFTANFFTSPLQNCQIVNMNQ